jgi:hypothetical protein
MAPLTDIFQAQLHCNLHIKTELEKCHTQEPAKNKPIGPQITPSVISPEIYNASNSLQKPVVCPVEMVLLYQTRFFSQRSIHQQRPGVFLLVYQDMHLDLSQSCCGMVAVLISQRSLATNCYHWMLKSFQIHKLTFRKRLPLALLRTIYSAC